MRIIVFGTGKYYEKRKLELAKLIQCDEIVCFLDNKFDEESEIDGIPAVNPNQLKNIEFDIILIMSIFYSEIYNQLCDIGVKSENIFTWKQYRSIKLGGRIEKWLAKSQGKGENVLIVAQPIRYDGGSMAAVYAGMALRSRGYCVWMISEYVEKELREIILREGINLALYQDFPYFGENIKQWINMFSVIIVNVFPNIHCACELSAFKPVIWWIHENDKYCEIYRNTFKLFPHYQKNIKVNTVNILAVSERAMMNFHKYYPDIDVNIMPYGLPDFFSNHQYRKKKMVFAIIGTISYLKGQDIFINAVKQLGDNEFRLAEFWIIGSTLGEYASKLYRDASNIDIIKFKGELSRKEIEQVFSQIDVVVSASREDALPIVVTEGMMNEKVCIIPNVIGTVKYINDMNNGIVFRSQDAGDLASKITWCINNRDRLIEMGMEARKTYIKEFSMAKFVDRLESEILCAKYKFKAENNSML